MSSLSSEVLLCSLGAAIRALIGSLEWDRWAKYVLESVTITSLFSQRGVGDEGTPATRKTGGGGGGRTSSSSADNDDDHHRKTKMMMMSTGEMDGHSATKKRKWGIEKDEEVDDEAEADEEAGDDDSGGFSRLRASDVHAKLTAFRRKLACVGCAPPQPQNEVDMETDCPVVDMPWSVVLHNRTEAMAYTSWKSSHDGGPYNEYVSSTVLFGVNPVDIAMFIMDFRNRSKMDSNTLAYQFVRTNHCTADDACDTNNNHKKKKHDDDDEMTVTTTHGTTNTGTLRGSRVLANETLCILTKFPMLLAPRRYVYERCSLAIGDEFYVVSSASRVPTHVKDTLPGAGQRLVDVDDFESVVCIRPARQYDNDDHGSGGAVEVVMNYFENPKLQPALCNFAAQASMWRLALEFHRNFTRYTSMCDESSHSQAIKRSSPAQSSSSSSSSPSSPTSSASALSSSLCDLYADGSVERLVKGVHSMIDEDSDDEHGSDARLRKLQSRVTRRNRIVVVAAGIVFVIGRSTVMSAQKRLVL